MMQKTLAPLIALLLAAEAHSDADNFLAYRLESPVALNEKVYDEISFDVSFGIGHTLLNGALLTSNGISFPFSGSCTATEVGTFFCSINVWHYSAFLTIFASDLSANLVVHNFGGVVLGSSALKLTSVK